MCTCSFEVMKCGNQFLSLFFILHSGLAFVLPFLQVYRYSLIIWRSFLKNFLDVWSRRIALPLASNRSASAAVCTLTTARDAASCLSWSFSMKLVMRMRSLAMCSRVGCSLSTKSRIWSEISEIVTYRSWVTVESAFRYAVAIIGSSKTSSNFSQNAK